MAFPTQPLEDLPLLRGIDWQSLSRTAQDKYIDKAFSFWRRRGFPYPSLGPNELRDKFQRLTLVRPETIFLARNELQSSNVGLEVANAFHPQIWSIPFARHRSPLQCFDDDGLLMGCLRKALVLWPDRKGASAAVLRDILRTFSHTRRVSNFRPTVAKALYSKYSTPGARILDFSAGFGGRLLGCLALERYYVGYDPCQAQISGLEHMYGAIRKLKLTRSRAEFHKTCAEEAMKLEQTGSFDLILTSPPYFDREKYSSEDTQSYIRYPTYTLWRDGFLATIIIESRRLLRRGGFLILNVANIQGAAIANDTHRLAAAVLRHVCTYDLRLPALPYQKGPNAYRHEPVFVFQKA
jgi:tRNA1(Val) A37 N6-methylase TrmN6